MAYNPKLDMRAKSLLLFLADGYSFKEIADIWGKSVSSINAHVIALKSALGAKNTTHLVRIAIENKIIEL